MVDVDWQLQRLVQGRPPCTVSKRFNNHGFWSVARKAL
ncbi:hypothetical protein HMPREF1494_1734 [Bifidobacterium sp. MSTE12]|nr:hypothetical protein HMPREF1494_1734 [Bifidobacterium sp. MSTE12]